MIGLALIGSWAAVSACAAIAAVCAAKGRFPDALASIYVGAAFGMICMLISSEMERAAPV